LPKLINDDQSGYIAGRYIGNNIRFIYDLINYLNVSKKPGLLLSIDFEKAFDSVDWKFMHKVLKAFGFGPDICKWISLFYTNIKSAVIVNGKVTQWFEVKRGCRQGDPVSAYLFILCAEILATMMRNNVDIKGINIKYSENKISQLADDKQIFLEGDEASFKNTIMSEIFEKTSGFKIHFDKCEVVWLGCKKNSKVIFMPELKI